MKSLTEKLKSRKFLAAVSGVLIGTGVIFGGNTVEGVVTVLASILAYLITEGYIDAKAVGKATQTAAEVAENVSEEIKTEK